jgi:hypothetical protein
VREHRRLVLGSKEEALVTSSRIVTVNDAAKLLGVSRRAVIELIADGKLTWTLAVDKRTVVVELPCDTDNFWRELGVFLKSLGAADRQSPPSKPDLRLSTHSAGIERPTITDFDAWSQPK